MKRSNWLVADGWIDEGAPRDRCSKCQAEIGHEHEKSCIARTRTVVMRVSLDLVFPVPEDSEIGALEATYGQGICGDDLARAAVVAARRMKGCLCPYKTVKFIREATADDEEAQALRINEYRS